jgi:AraC-like DNA-binding protein
MFAQNRHKSMSLEGIANMVGYQSRSTFNTAFKKNTGVTPSVYIKMLKELKEVDGE